MNMFQLILSPGNGWEDIDSANENPRKIAKSGYYPLIAVTAASVFIQGIYHQYIPFIVLFLRMFVTFLVYFIAYFFGTFILSIFVESTLNGRSNGKLQNIWT